MSCSKDIKCDLCGYQFKTYSVVEKHCIDYEMENVTCWYPAPDENAHIVHNWICDTCYNDLDNIVLNSLIKAGIDHIASIDKRRSAAYKKYWEELKKINDDNARIRERVERLESITSTTQLTDAEIDYYSGMFTNYPYSKGGYYLDRVKHELNKKI